MELRAHQTEFKFACLRIREENAAIKKIVCNVTPGGGKSLLPMIAAATLGYKIVWIVPRVSLQTQAEEVFQDENLRRLAGYFGTGIRKSTNEKNPARNLDGFVTTYQALSRDTGELEAYVGSRPTCLVLDECAHVHQDACVATLLQKLSAACRLLILMSGTIERHDGSRISFLDYEVDEEEEVLDLEKQKAAAVITYSRADALGDQSIIPLRATYLDASASWSKGTKMVEIDSLKNVKGSNAGRALFVALKTEYAISLLDMCCVDWHATNYNQCRASKLLVVAPNQKEARRYHDWLKTQKIKSALAIEEEGVKSQRAIKDFRRGDLPCLVTVLMAYEGLDVPQISHVAILTRIRSKPWLTQCLSRATRVDKSLPYENQEAHIFVPDDTKMRRIIGLIEKEQAEVIKRRATPVQNALPHAGGGRDLFGDIIPISSKAHGKRSQRLFSGPSAALVTPSEQEMDIRDKIEHHIRSYAARKNVKPATINAKVKAKFGKSRTEMTLAELERVKIFVEGTMR